MDNQKRLFLALALSFAVTTVYVLFFSTPVPAPSSAPDASVTTVVPRPAVTPLAAVVASDVPAAHPTAAEPVQHLSLGRAGAQYELSTQGAVLESAVLLGDKEREQQQVKLAEGWGRLFGKKPQKPPQMNLARAAPGAPGPLAVSIESTPSVRADASYHVESAGPQRVVFRAEQEGWEVVKTVEWPTEGHELYLSVSVRNTSAVARTGELRLYFSRSIDPKSEEAPSMFGGVGNQASAVCKLEKDFHKRAPSSDPPDEYTGQVRFFGVDHQYFLSALFPLDAAFNGRCVVEATPTERRAFAGLPLSLAPGESLTRHFGVYLGPKTVDGLTGVPSSQLLALARQAGLPTVTDPELEQSVDFGIWAVICKVLLFAMKLFHGLTKNWGVAIVLLTVVVKLVLFPLTHRSMVGMEAMKKLQPKVEALKKKFPDDRERQQMETMKLYQEAKVNPFGSCLLMLVQMPVWFALYTTLRTSYELYNEPFLSPVWTDLTYKDPTYVLPVLLGISMVITSKLQPPSADPIQAKMLTYFMPLTFAVLLLNTPAGLTLYMVTNNVLSILQSYALRRYLSRGEATA